MKIFSNKFKNTSILKEYDLYSFDIFDTLITRRVADPSGIFALMQEYLIENNVDINNFVKHNFYNIRIGAEELARRNNSIINKCSEIFIDDIYNCIKNQYHLTNEQVLYLKNLEIKMEVKNIVPMKENINLLKQYLNKGKRVILISDMYYNTETIRSFLCKFDSVFNDIKIYVSSEIGKSKNDGDLYKYIAAVESYKEENWIHFGDNIFSDVKMPNRLGIKSMYLPKVKCTPYELKLLDNYADNICFQTVIGASHYARINVNKNLKNIDKYIFGASFAGPILYNYANWVVEQAQILGVKTLYFVARDGYIPQKIVDEIIKYKNLDLKTKYIYGSRKVWRKPIAKNINKYLDSIFNEYCNRISPKFLEYRLGISSKYIMKVFNLKSETKLLKNKMRKIMLESFKSDNELKEELLKANKNSIDILSKYLKQEINFKENDKILFVDLCGSGLTLDFLADIINTNIEKCSIYSMYLLSFYQEQKNISKKMCYFSNISYNSPWIEILCRNKQGQTIAYEENSDKIYPVTETVNPEIMEDWGFDDYLSGIINFTKEILETEQINLLTSNSLRLFIEYSKFYMHDLDKETATIMGSIPYKSVGSEKKCQPAATKISLIKRVVYFLICKRCQVEEFFHSIVCARSSRYSNAFEKFTDKIPTLQKFLIDVFIHKKRKIAYIRILGIKISFSRLIWRKK